MLSPSTTPDTPNTPSRATVMDVQHLRKTVRDADGELTILHDISFALHEGECAAVVGASGSGKSTLLSLVAGLDTPSSGTVQYFVDGQGKDIFKLDEDARAALRGQLVGFVFQSFQLVPHLNALENVMLPLELMGRTKEAKPLARAMLERVGLASRLTHFPKTLSGGEQQRVALARAFVVSPKLLLADEPTGNLDHATGERIIELMFELNRELGTTLMLVTHDRALAARADKTLEIAEGRLMNGALSSSPVMTRENILTPSPTSVGEGGGEGGSAAIRVNS